MTTGSSSFAYLTENTPDWITRLDDLTARISSRQAELSQLTNSSNSNNSNSNNNNNNNNKKNKNKNNADTNATPTADRNNPKDAAERLQKLHDDQHRRRKRKTASISSVASGSQRYRSRSMVIVYYDSAVQETFEALVRGIGTARNNVRKAKMNVRMRSWSALAGSEDDGDAMRSRFILPRSSARSTGGEKTVYDTVDGLLETAQGQCETGAHQFLRDGDCRKEIESARKKLEEVRELAAEELEKLLREEEEQQKQQEEQEQQQEQGEGEEEKEEGDSREVQVEIKRQESPGDEGIEVEDDDGAEGEEYQIPLDWKRRYARA